MNKKLFWPTIHVPCSRIGFSTSFYLFNCIHPSEMLQYKILMWWLVQFAKQIASQGLMSRIGVLLLVKEC